MFKLMKIHVVDLLTKNRQWIIFTALVVRRDSATSNWIAQSLFLSAFVCSSVCPCLLWSPNNMQCNSSSAVCFNWIRTKFGIVNANKFCRPASLWHKFYTCLPLNFRFPWTTPFVDRFSPNLKQGFLPYFQACVSLWQKTDCSSQCVCKDWHIWLFDVLLRMLRMQMKNQPHTSEYCHQIWHVSIEYYKAYPYDKPKLVFGHARNSSIFTLSDHWTTYSVSSLALSVLNWFASSLVLVHSKWHWTACADISLRNYSLTHSLTPSPAFVNFVLRLR